MNRTLAVAGAFALATCLSPDTWATPLSASMYLQADATVGTSSSSDSDSADWSGTPVSLSVEVFAAAGAGGLEQPFASVGGLAEAFWAPDGNSGSVLFTGYGWDVDTTSDSSAVNLFQHAGGDDWTYTFVADSDGVFSMDFLVKGSGDTFGLWGWAITWTGIGGGLPLPGTAFSPDASGIFARDVVAGEIYTVGLSNNANVSSSPGALFSGSMDGSFDWEIAVVPEPSTWALLTLGLAVVGWKRRR